MLIWGRTQTDRPGWMAAAAFSALSLPLLFVAASPEPQPTTEAVGIGPALTAPAVPATPPAEKTSTTPPAKAQEGKARRTHKRIVVSIPERKLALLEAGHVVKTYSIAVGAEVSPSPTGEFKIVSKVSDPTYYRPGMIITPGPANPLGSRWLGLDREHFGIHGTNEPASIGQAASHGCIRMANRDVEELFALAQAGDSVEISEAPLQQLAHLQEPIGGAEGQ
jgi:lipoprotein-anchoring transpeptidase ErfK/SrfK